MVESVKIENLDPDGVNDGKIVDFVEIDIFSQKFEVIYNDGYF